MYRRALLRRKLQQSRLIHRDIEQIFVIQHDRQSLDEWSDYIPVCQELEMMPMRVREHAFIFDLVILEFLPVRI